MTFEELLNSREKKGKALGKAEAILELLEDYGIIPDEIKEKVLVERDIEILKKWHKLAARVTSIEEFTEKMQFYYSNEKEKINVYQSRVFLRYRKTIRYDSQLKWKEQYRKPI